jgi:uncharacterized membrane protein YphA (DoxX/SURF4 family)
LYQSSSLTGIEILQTFSGAAVNARTAKSSKLIATFFSPFGPKLKGGKVMLVSRELNAAYWALRVAYGLGPLLAGLDKFTNILVDWQKYLSPAVLRMLPISGAMFMRVVGGIEIIVGLAILFGASRVFGYIAMLWLWAIAANLILTGTYYDIAVRDILLGTGAYALARITEARYSVLYVDRDELRAA